MLREFYALDKIFNPNSVAIIGASNKEGSFGHTFVNGLNRMGFPNIFPVNPRETQIQGIIAYPSIKDVPQVVDVAVILVPPKAVLDTVKDCVKVGIKGLIIFTAGFGERGQEGKLIEQELGNIARESGTRIIGPNSIGIYSPSSRFLTMPLGLLEPLPIESGPLGMFSQSGSTIDFLAWNLSRKGMRFSKTVSCGNECDLNDADYVEYLGQDSQTRIIAAYMEGVKDGRRFYRSAREVSKKKPIILWKTGTTEAGAIAASSHTGALAGSNAIWETMFKQSGIVNVTCFEELIDCITAFYYLPPPQGRRIAVISGMGGTGVGSIDNALKYGLEIASLSQETKDSLEQLISSVGTKADNPIDLGPLVVLDPSIHEKVIDVVAKDPNVDMILVVLSKRPGSVDSVIKAVKDCSKPVAVTLLTLAELSAVEYEQLVNNRVATFGEAKRAIYALSRVCEYLDFVKSTQEAII